MERVLAVASTVVGLTLTAGVLLWAAGQDAAANLAVGVGLLLLMAAPVARLIAAIVHEVRARDWRFAALGLVALALLGVSVLISI